VRELRTRAARRAFLDLLHPGFLDWLGSPSGGGADADEAGRQTEGKALTLIRAVNEAIGPDALNEAAFAERIRRGFVAVLLLPAEIAAGDRPLSAPLGAGLARPSLFAWAVLRALTPARAADLGLDAALAEFWLETAGDNLKARQAVHAIRALAGWDARLDSAESAAAVASRLADKMRTDPDFRAALLVNEYQGREYFHQESFDRLLWWLEASAAADPGWALLLQAVLLLRDSAARSDFRLDRL
jgi:hypothetical protein